MRKKTIFSRTYIIFIASWVQDIESIPYLDFKRMLKLLVQMTKTISHYSFAS